MMGAGSWRSGGAKPSVDVELVALRVLHPHRVPIEAVLAHGSGERGPEIRQPPGLSVDPLRAGGERDRAAAADVDVEVEAVLDHLGVRHHMEPDAGAAALGIDDAVRADAQLTVGKPEVAPPVVPRSEPFGGWFQHVSQGSRPEAGQQFGVLAVDDELESGRHRALLSATGSSSILTQGYDTGRGAGQAAPQRTLPGFMMPSGSSASLIDRCTAIDSSPISWLSQRRLTTPTPCSPVSVPPSSSAALNTSSAAAHTLAGTSSSPRSKTKAGCRFPSPACATVAMKTSCRFAARSIRSTISGRRLRGTQTSSARTRPSRSTAG